MNNKTKVAVSACLLGQRVRYDGREKTHSLIVDLFLNQYSDILELVPFCPEVAIGLGVPRAKIQLVKEKNDQIRVLGVENHTLDVSEPLKSYAEMFLKQYSEINHYIVKSKSPSCGFQSTPLFKFLDQKNNLYEQSEFTSGFFVQNLLAIKPDLIIIEETQLATEGNCLNFIQSITT